MAYLYRIGAWLLLALSLCMVWTPARAETPVTQYAMWTYAACGNVTWYTTINSAGQDAVTCRNLVYPSPPNSSCVFTHMVGSNAYGNCTNPANGSVSTGLNIWGTQSRSWCLAANTSPTGSPAACPPPPDLSGDCNAIASALNFIGKPLVHYGSVGLTACYAGFVIAGSGGAAGGGQSELYGPYKCGGTAPTTCSAVPKPSSIVVTCDPGSYPGTVNGVQVCVPPAATVEAPKTTTATPPAPGASAPQIPNAPAGTTSQSEQTVCTGTSCTKTILYKDDAGNSKGSKTEEVSKADYCAENPKAPGCTPEKSSFGGGCTSGFTYNGDAIQGAIAQEIYRQNCLMNQPTDESTLYTTEKAKTGDQTGTLPGNQTVTVSPGDFNTTDAIGGAACITDKTIVVWGRTVVMPFSTVCPVLGYLKSILLAVSYLAAAGIVVGRRS